MRIPFLFVALLSFAWSAGSEVTKLDYERVRYEDGREFGDVGAYELISDWQTVLPPGLTPSK